MAKESYSYPYSDEKGNYTFRTIGGRKVKIYEHQSVADAMIESGKFKGQKNKKGARESYREEKEKDYKEQEELYEKYKKANEETSNVQEEAHEYMKKVADNNEKYEDTYEKRKEREDRQEQVDKERGKAEPLREKYREENEIGHFEEKDGKKIWVESEKYKQEKEKIAQQFKEKEQNALKNKDYSYDYSKETLSKMTDEDLNNYINKQQEMNNEYTNKANQSKTYDQRRTQNRQDTLWNSSMATKTERNLKDAKEELDRRKQSTNEKQVEEKTIHTQSGSYTPKELEQRDNEIKDLYKSAWNGDMSYKQLNDKLEGLRKDGKVSYGELSSLQYDASREYDKELDKSKTPDKSSNEEQERLDIARDIAKEMYQLNDKNSTQEKIDKYARDIMEYTDGEVTNETPYKDKNGNIQRSTQSLRDWREKLNKTKESKTTNETMNNAIREKASKGKVYTLDDGTPIDQNYMKQLYSGRSYDDIKRQNDVEKEWLDNVKPEMRERQEAFIKETDKYLDSMEKYESRISDDFSTKERKTGYPFSQGTAWEGTKSNSGLYGKDKIKAIDDEIKKAYPNLKTSRKTAQGGMTDSFSYSITESDKPIIRDISDFSDTEIERLYNEGYNRNWYNTKEDFKDHIKKELESGQFDINHYHIDNDYRLTPYGKQVFKDIMKVSNAYNYDESDSMTDYFNTGHYISLHVGKDGKPYQTTNSKMNDTIRTQANMKNAYKQYLKEHPESKMSLKDFRNMKK